MQRTATQTSLAFWKKDDNKELKKHHYAHPLKIVSVG